MDYRRILNALDDGTSIHEVGHALAIAALVPSRQLLYAQNQGLGSGLTGSVSRDGMTTPADEGLYWFLSGAIAEAEILGREPIGFEQDSEAVAEVLLAAGVPRERWRGRIEQAAARLRVFMQENRGVVAEAALELRQRGFMAAADLAPFVARLTVPREDPADRLARAIVATGITAAIIQRAEREVQAIVSAASPREETLADVLRAKRAEAR